MRSESLALLIKENQGISSDGLSRRLGVSARSVRKYISACNESLSGCASIAFRRVGEKGSGYYLDVVDERAFQDWVDRAKAFQASSLYDSQDGRVRYILNDLLMRNGWVTRDDLSETLYVSPACVTLALKDVEAILHEFGLELEKRPRYGLRVIGSEVSRRLCWVNEVVHHAGYGQGGAQDSHGSCGCGAACDTTQMDEFRWKETIEVARQCVNEALDAADFQINSFSHDNLLIHIGTAIVRIREGCYVSMPSEQIAQGRYTREYEVAKLIGKNIETALQVRFPEEEVAYITMHLAGRHPLASLDATEGPKGNTIPDDVWETVSTILNQVYEVYQYDFHGDLELRMNLAQHIVPLATRLRFNLMAKNPMVRDIKERYPLAFAMAGEAASVLASVYGSMLDEDEIGYLALAFAVAIERKKSGAAKKRVLIVCATGRGTARLLEYRFRKEFASFVDRIETCDVQQIAKVDFTGIDYVFTTVPLGVAVPVPVCEVGLFLDDVDCRAVRAMLEGGGYDAWRYLDERLFIPHLTCSSKDETLRLMVERVRSCRSVDDDFLELIEKRERLAPTAFGGLVALPHPLTPASDESFVCVGLLDHSVEWCGHEVRAVFMLSIAREADEGLKQFYDIFSDLMFDTDSINMLLSNQRFEVLQALFTR